MNRRLLLMALVPLLSLGGVVRAEDVPAPAETGIAYVVGFIETTPRAAKTAVGALGAYARASRREPGDPDVRVLQELGKPGRFMILEHWADAAAQAAHEKGQARKRLLTATAAGSLAPADFRSHRAFIGDPLPAARGPNAVYVMTHLDVAPPLFAPLQPPLHLYFDQTRAKVTGQQVLQHIDPRRNHLTALELWPSRAAFDAQRAGVSARRFRDAVTPILGALYDERLYRALP